MKKSLFVNGLESLRITCEEGITRYFSISNDQALCEVSFAEFMKSYSLLGRICLNTWNKNLMNDYLDFGDLLRDMINIQ